MNSNGIESERKRDKPKSENDRSLDVLDEKDEKCLRSSQNYANINVEKHGNDKQKRSLDQNGIHHKFDQTQRQESSISVKSIGSVADGDIPDTMKKTDGSWYENDKLS